MENIKPKQITDLSHLNNEELLNIIQKTDKILQSEDMNSLGYKLSEKTNRIAKEEQQKRQTTATQ